MPTKAALPCKTPGCPNLVPCKVHGDVTERQYNRARGSSHQQGYTWGWRKASGMWLKQYPLCAIHLAEGMPVEATLVDHIVAHGGDRQRFWDRANWGSLCMACHNRKTSAERDSRQQEILRLQGLERQGMAQQMPVTWKPMVG
jgi:5-methylcytosine-specific restriction enzyme A